VAMPSHSRRCQDATGLSTSAVNHTTLANARASIVVESADGRQTNATSTKTFQDVDIQTSAADQETFVGHMDSSVADSARERS